MLGAPAGGAVEKLLVCYTAVFSAVTQRSSPVRLCSRLRNCLLWMRFSKGLFLFHLLSELTHRAT